MYYVLNLINIFLGIVRFHEVAVSETEREGGEEMLTTTGSLLEHYVQSVRDSLGVQSQLVLMIFSHCFRMLFQAVSLIFIIKHYHLNAFHISTT